MIARIVRYAVAYPLAFFALFGAGWTCGLTALAALASGTGPWRPDAGVAASALSLAVYMLLARVIDDLRDVEYDRVHNPDRPLARGAVKVGDLAVLIGLCGAGLLVLNMNRGAPALLLGAAFAYALALLEVHRRWAWPPSERVLAQFAIHAPLQWLVSGYVYWSFLDAHAGSPNGRGVLAILAISACLLHLEFARKVNREPRPGENAYATIPGGASGVAGAGLAAAIGAAGIGLAAAHVSSSSVRIYALLVGVPLVAAAHGALRFWGERASRWPMGHAVLYVFGTFSAFTLAGALGQVP